MQVSRLPALHPAAAAARAASASAASAARKVLYYPKRRHGHCDLQVLLQGGQRWEALLDVQMPRL